MNKIYVAHPYDGLQENKIKVENIIKSIIDNGSRECFISPIHAFEFLYTHLDYIKGMNHCLELLKTCDALMLCGDWQNSKGCTMEYAYAKAGGMTIINERNEEI